MQSIYKSIYLYVSIKPLYFSHAEHLQKHSSLCFNQTIIPLTCRAFTKAFIFMFQANHYTSHMQSIYKSIYLYVSIKPLYFSHEQGPHALIIYSGSKTCPHTPLCRPTIRYFDLLHTHPTI